MLDHVDIIVRDIAKSRAFYKQSLLPLGFSVEMEIDQNNAGGKVVGFGTKDDPFFTIADGERPNEGLHIAFRADSRALVDAFYEAAIAAGGKDNGKPGIREKYGPTYYAAFVYDPDGFNVEAVCHKPA